MTRVIQHPALRVGLLIAALTATIAFAVSSQAEFIAVLLLPALLAGLLFGRGAGALTGALSVPIWATSRQLALDLHAQGLGELAIRMLTFATAGFVAGWLVQQHSAAESARRTARDAQRRSRKLAADALEAEASERRRISESLHDGALQTLLSASQDLAQVHQGNPGSLQRAAVAVNQATKQLRQAVSDLHPVSLEHGGLALALPAVAHTSAREGGFNVRVRVAMQATGAHDHLVLSAARELLRNAAKHAQAQEVTVSLMRCGSNVVLEVSDDGKGICPQDQQAAVGEGHIGLACIRERVVANGGELAVNTGDGRGTTVEVTLPVAGASLEPQSEKPLGPAMEARAPT
jgi:two-component system, NarL family, sensor kinase